MRIQSVRPAAALLGAALVTVCAAAASAGPVTPDHGRIFIAFDPTGNPQEHVLRNFDIAFPGAGDHTFDGGGETPIGLGRVKYTIGESDTGATFDLLVTTEHDGAPAAFGSASDFSLNFTTDRALRYRLEGDVLSALFDVQLGDFRASAVRDADGFPSGTWPIRRGDARGDISFRELIRDGVLPAGTHVFSVRASAPASDDTAFAGGSVRLELAADDGPAPAPIPLPLAAWAGLSVFGGIVASHVRFRRARR